MENDKMSYKLISKSNYFTENLLEVICRNRKVDINKIKNPSINDTVEPTKLVNMDKLMNVFRVYGQQKEVEVGLVVDSDP